jgi:hypothetical protein
MDYDEQSIYAKQSSASQNARKLNDIVRLDFQSLD